jgi:hypothetical protein
MALKRKVASLADIPEKYHGLYEESDGAFVLVDVEGLVPAEKVSEFRDKNTGLMKKMRALEEHIAKYKDGDGYIDPDEYRALKEASAKEHGAGSSELEQKIAMLSTQIMKIQKQHADQLASEQAEKEEAKQKLDEYKIDTELTRGLVESGIKKEALEDGLSRGRRLFRIKDGALVAMRGDEEVYSERKTTERLTVDEWAKHVLIKEAPHFYPASSGGGAGGNMNTKQAGVKIIDGSDPVMFGRYAKEIAEGKVVVQ